MPPLFQLGKQPARHDPRDLLFRAILKGDVTPPPDTYDVDAAHPQTPIPVVMGCNDQVGDCVLVGIFNMIRQFEYKEQGLVLTIPDEEIKAQYLTLTNGHDVGLNMNDTLNWMVHEGWTIKGKTYKFDAYAKVDHTNPTEVKTAASGHMGLLVGVALPDNWADAFANNTRVPWTNTSLAPDNDNGHCMHHGAYSPDDVRYSTWGGYEHASWPWCLKYTDEAFYIIDARDPWIDMNRVGEFKEGLK
jgi:hypothetical protein